MQRQPLRVFFAIIVLLISASMDRVNPAPEAKPELPASPLDLVNAVNNIRAAYGLPPYSISPILMTTAQNQADYMAATGSVSHTGEGGSSVTDRLLAAGYPLAGQLSLGGFRAENITSGSETMSAQAAVDQWAGDSLHLTTMISPDLTEMGAGISINAGRAYFVIDCARSTNSGDFQAAGTPLTAGTLIPVVVSTPNVNGEVIHEVKAGETLWQIAISYDATIDEIKRLNNLVGNNIYPGTKLLIKKNVSTSPLAPGILLATVSPTTTPKTTFLVPTLMPSQVKAPLALPSKNIMGSVIGILVVALLGGGIFVWLGRIEK
ncbi:MAG TPA: CAP domain-containing protein [Anaerolineales bacterium]|nr:CAP domain-containing protein [Anaerolineales bacterium]